eukprot:5497344-Pleurochrysis_carterae.AAC.1
MDLVSVATPTQPIRVKNNVYKGKKDIRITSFNNIKAFRAVAESIDELGIIGPWSEQFNMYTALGISNWRQ